MSLVKKFGPIALGLAGILSSCTKQTEHPTYTLKLSRGYNDRIVQFDVVGDEVHIDDSNAFNVQGLCYKGGKVVGGTPKTYFEIRKRPAFKGYLVAHAIPWDIKNPEGIDKIVFEFRFNDNKDPRLPEPLEIAITPETFAEYWHDKTADETSRVLRAMELSKKYGIAEARY